MERTKYFPGIDGLRGIAVIAIILYHLNPKWLPGGFLGVDTFFIISGYIITVILLREYNKDERIDLVNFYQRRIRRLIPALLWMIMIVLMYSMLFERQIVHQLKHDVIAAIFYVSNWFYIYDGLDYFQSLEVRPLQHLWSLAIEEQFYILFPVVLLWSMKRFEKMRIVQVVFGISLLSLLLMMILFDPAEGSARVYFGTDTRLQSMLLGVMFAFIWNPDRMKESIPSSTRHVVDVIGVVSLIVLLLSFYLLSDTSEVLFYGGLYGLGIVTLLIIGSVVVPGTWMASVVGHRSLVTVGQYSYSLYLWHYPAIVFMSMHYVKGQLPWFVYIGAFIVTVAMAMISYHLIEEPFRKYGLKGLLVRIDTYKWTLLSMVITLLSSIGMWLFIDTTPKPVEKPKSTTHNLESYNQKKPSLDKLHEYEVFMLGDSVMVDIEDDLRKYFPHAYIDGEIGRNIYKAIPLIEEYQQFNTNDSVVVLELGTNGDFEQRHMEQMVNGFIDAKVILITTRVPKAYEKNVNELMKEAASRHDHITIVDWYKISEGHPEYFAPDGIHLQPVGAEVLSRAIKEEIAKRISE